MIKLYLKNFIFLGSFLNDDLIIRFFIYFFNYFIIILKNIFYNRI